MSMAVVVLGTEGDVVGQGGQLALGGGGVEEVHKLRLE